MESVVKMLEFYKDKIVLITGHTGFKGSWLSRILIDAGAKVIGYSLAPAENPNLFNMTHNSEEMVSIIGDVRDLNRLRDIFSTYRPEIVFHLAAQPLVLDSYINPLYTYEVNVMGTINILECIRIFPCVKSFINVTTDKVYENNDLAHAFIEEDKLNGYEPYANSKSCSELITSSYRRSFFQDRSCAITTMRAGNVIGGGDFSKNRIIPDCIKFANENKTIILRHPESVRPYQHVLEPLFAYLIVAKEQFNNIELQGSYNVGPDLENCISTQELVETFCNVHGNAKWESKIIPDTPHESKFLCLNCNLIKKTFNWKPIWNVKTAIEKTIEWNEHYTFDEKTVLDIMQKQIEEYIKESEI